VFRVASIEEAQTFANTDPVIQAGRLRLELHPLVRREEHHRLRDGGAEEVEILKEK
jgi:hypothetical protein